MSSPVTLYPQCIAKQGYLIKSPPLNETSLIRRRWRLRWFVLYDTKELSDIDPAVAREVYLYYYKSDKKVVEGTPKGEISLTGVEIFKQRGRLYGYDHVINIQTSQRLYHLCATQIFVYNEWMVKLRQHYIPYQETSMVNRSRCGSCESYLHLESRRKSAPVTQKTLIEKRIVNSVSEDREEEEGDEYDYVYEHFTPNYTNAVCQPARAQTCKVINSVVSSRLNTTSLHIPMYKPPVSKRTETEVTVEEEESPYVGMKRYQKLSESEDEGIGRTDSESSNISSPTIAKLNDVIPNFTSRDKTRDYVITAGFVGPKLQAKKKTMSRAHSLGDMQIHLDLKPVVRNDPFEL